MGQSDIFLFTLLWLTSQFWVSEWGMSAVSAGAIRHPHSCQVASRTCHLSLCIGWGNVFCESSNAGTTVSSVYLILNCPVSHHQRDSLPAPVPRPVQRHSSINREGCVRVLDVDKINPRGLTFFLSACECVCGAAVGLYFALVGLMWRWKPWLYWYCRSRSTLNWLTGRAFKYSLVGFPEI